MMENNDQVSNHSGISHKRDRGKAICEYESRLAHMTGNIIGHAKLCLENEWEISRGENVMESGRSAVFPTMRLIYLARWKWGKQ